jgi:hypothetical protein
MCVCVVSVMGMCSGKYNCVGDLQFVYKYIYIHIYTYIYIHIYTYTHTKTISAGQFHV